MVSRREFLKFGLATGAGLYLSSRPRFIHRVRAYDEPVDGSIFPQYQTPLVIPPAMPRTARLGIRKKIDYYEIAVRQFNQQVLPAGFPQTPVWGYGSVNHPGSFNYPAFTIEAKWQTPVRVKWINQLVADPLATPGTSPYLPHLLPVDPTLHWANPPGGVAGRDSRPVFTNTPGPYTGPVPMVVHVHGAERVGDESDGFAEAWFLPDASGIPGDYATTGTWYDTFKAKFAAMRGIGHPSDTWDPGSATFQYVNEQRATTLWYHDHTLGMTRLNVYAGPAGFYLLRGGPADQVLDSRSGMPAVLPGPGPALGDPAGVKYYEIPLGIQDRSFHGNGSLFYPDSREFFDEIPPFDDDGNSNYIPDTDISPIWNPEFFGNTMLVNGNTWPYLTVEQRRYRFRFLNGCNSRFLILTMDNGTPFWQIGAEGGFLAAPVQLNQLLMAPAERADVIMDFNNVPAGTVITLLNLGPDEPFGGGIPDDDFEPADPATTGQVMQFRVVRSPGIDKSTPPQFLQLPAFTAVPAGTPRQLALIEMMSMYGFDAPVEALLGVMEAGSGVSKMWDDPITENPVAGIPEVWEIHNFTADAHPIHIHNTQFQVENREGLALEADDETVVQPVQYTGAVRGPEAWETGLKDTVISYPGEVIRVRVKFDLSGLYVWHCHIVEHEDNEMMRPLQIG